MNATEKNPDSAYSTIAKDVNDIKKHHLVLKIELKKINNRIKHTKAFQCLKAKDSEYIKRHRNMFDKVNVLENKVDKLVSDDIKSSLADGLGDYIDNGTLSEAVKCKVVIYYIMKEY